MFGFGKKKPFDPAKDTGERRPVYVTVVPTDVADKYSEYPSNGLTPKKLAQIFRAADEGDVRAQMELFEEVEEKDTHIGSQFQTRKLAVTKLNWNVQPTGEEDSAKEVAEFIENQLKHVLEESDILFDILDAISKGVSVSEIIWDIDRHGHDVIKEIRWIHPKKLIWDSLTDEMKICTKEYPAGVSLPENKFVYHRYKARSGHASRAGILRPVTWMYLFKNYDIKDWVSFCEVYGMPVRIGKYDPSASEDDKMALMEALYRIGTDAAGMVPTTTELQFVESNKTASADMYEKLARYCDEQNSKAILGQTLTADTGGGSYAQGKVHNDVRSDLTDADAKALAKTIKRDIIRPLVLYNFGPEMECPDFYFESKDMDDLKAVAEIYRTLACDLRLPIPREHIYKKFSVPEPEEGEPLLEPGPITAQERPPDELGLKALKAEEKDKVGTQVTQDKVDELVVASEQHAGKLFEQMLEPLQKLIENSRSLEEAREKLTDVKQLKKVYEVMDETGLQDLLAQGLFLSEMLGRMTE